MGYKKKARRVCKWMNEYRKKNENMKIGDGVQPNNKTSKPYSLIMEHIWHWHQYNNAHSYLSLV